MDTDRDLAAVRELRAAQGEPTELALARVRRRVTTSMGGTGSTPDRPRRSWVPALGAAAAVLAVAGLVVAIQSSRAGSPQPAPPQQIGAEPTSSATPATAKPPTVDMTLTPVALAPGQLVYVKWQSAGGDPPMESWIDPQGMITVQLDGTTSAGQPIFQNATDLADYIAHQRAQLTANGPSLIMATPSYLAGLPTDPATLYALMYTQFAADAGKGSRPDLIFSSAGELFRVAEPLLSPAVRAAFLQALIRAPGAHADHTPRTVGGRSVYLIEQKYGVNVSAMVVDSTTGRIVGQFNGRDALVEADIELWTFAVVAAPGQRP